MTREEWTATWDGVSRWYMNGGSLLAVGDEDHPGTGRRKAYYYETGEYWGPPTVGQVENYQSFPALTDEEAAEERNRIEASWYDTERDKRIAQLIHQENYEFQADVRAEKRVRDGEVEPGEDDDFSDDSRARRFYYRLRWHMDRIAEDLVKHEPAHWARLRAEAGVGSCQ